LKQHSKAFAILGLSGLCLLGQAGAAPVDNSPFVGRWHLNKAQSKLPPGEPVAADIIADFARIETTHVKWTVTVTNGQGQPATDSFDVPANGEYYPISSQTMAAFNLTDATLKATFKEKTGISDVLICELSPNKAKMTCRGMLTGNNGKTNSYIDVYDRS
jgi:hypothetical protein